MDCHDKIVIDCHDNDEFIITNYIPFKNNKLDSVVSNVIDNYIARANVGFQKYGKNMDRNDLTIDEWITHMQEELMDATLYLEKIKQIKLSNDLEFLDNLKNELTSKKTDNEELQINIDRIEKLIDFIKK
jgi:hypothetical protein